MNASMRTEFHNKFRRNRSTGMLVISDTYIYTIVSGLEFPYLRSPIYSSSEIDILDKDRLKDMQVTVLTDFKKCRCEFKLINNVLLMFDGKINLMIEMLELYIARDDDYKYINLITHQIHCLDPRYYNFDQDNEPDVYPDYEKIYNMGLKVLIDYITYIYKLNKLSNYPRDNYNLSDYYTYNMFDKLDLHAMLIIFNDLTKKYKCMYEQHLNSINRAYCEIISRYRNIVKLYKSQVNS